MTEAEGTVKGTGWPIDGHRLVFRPVGKDGELWRLCRWGNRDDRAVMQTMFWAESLAGICEHATLEPFAKEWDAGKWKPAEGFLLDRGHLEGLREICREGRDGSMEGDSGSADCRIAAWGMHGTGRDTGCNPTGADAVAEPGWVRDYPAPIGQGKVAKPARVGAGAGNGTV